MEATSFGDSILSGQSEAQGLLIDVNKHMVRRVTLPLESSGFVSKESLM